MEAIDKSSELVGLTRDIIAAIQQFEGLLHEEAEALEQQDKSSLFEIADRKIRYADHLDHLVRARARTLAALGIQEQPGQAPTPAEASDKQLTLLSSQWERAMKTLQNCWLMNEQAGSMINAQRQQAQRGLELLTGSSHSTYDPRGLVNGSGARTELGMA